MSNETVLRATAPTRELSSINFCLNDSERGENLLKLAECRQIELLIPAYCLGNHSSGWCAETDCCTFIASSQINKNTRDFLIPEIVEDFEAHNCKLIGKFSDGLHYARSTLSADIEPNEQSDRLGNRYGACYVEPSARRQQKRHPLGGVLFLLHKNVVPTCS